MALQSDDWLESLDFLDVTLSLENTDRRLVPVSDFRDVALSLENRDRRLVFDVRTTKELEAALEARPLRARDLEER